MMLNTKCVNQEQTELAKYDKRTQSLIRLAYNDQTGINAGMPADYDFKCPIIYSLGLPLLYAPTSTQPTIDFVEALTKLDMEQLYSVFAI